MVGAIVHALSIRIFSHGIMNAGPSSNALPQPQDSFARKCIMLMVNLPSIVFLHGLMAWAKEPSRVAFFALATIP